MKYQIVNRIARAAALLAIATLPAVPNATASPSSSRKMAPAVYAYPTSDRAHWRAYHLRDIQVSDDKTTSTAVLVGGTTIMRFRNSAGGYTPEQRALLTQERVNAILGMGPILPSDITTSIVDGDAIVSVKGQLLFTADTLTAVVNDSTPLQLANMWAENMRSVLPSLTDAR